MIISNAHAINAGQMPTIDNKSKDFFYEEKQTQEDIANTILSLVSTRLPKYLGIDSLKIQVLAPMRAGVCGRGGGEHVGGRSAGDVQEWRGGAFPGRDGSEGAVRGGRLDALRARVRAPGAWRSG